MTNPDPVTLQIIRSRVSSLMEEMDYRFYRSGYSTIVRESRDFSCVVTDRDGRLAVAPHADGSVDLFDRAGNRLIRSLRGHDRLVNRVRFSSDSSVFVTGYASNGFVNSHDERRVCVWTAAGELLQQIEFERSGVCWLDLSADGEWVLVKTNDGDLRRYPVRPLQLVEQLSLRDFTEAERERFEIR